MTQSELFAGQHTTSSGTVDLFAEVVFDRPLDHAFTYGVGACLRGRLAEDSGGLRLLTERVTWWRGFKVRTQPARRRVPAAVVAQ